MIKLHDGEPLSVLPVYFKEDPDAIAFSYAIKQGMTKLLTFSAMSELYANIDNLPNEILDLVAIELKSQYYNDAMDITIKRKIIKSSLAWYAKGGTISAVNEMIQTVFGDGQVIEWPDFNGEPGTFYIETSAEITPEAIKLFSEIIDKVKNKSSKFISLQVQRDLTQDTRLASHVRRVPHYKIYNSEL